jgi:putative aldouronate transport system permease protein
MVLYDLLKDPTVFIQGKAEIDVSLIKPHDRRTNLKMATIVVALLPIMMLYPFLQKNFTAGIMVGAVKE